ncbi:unnamed protein product [Merluccius merluccius]
MVALRSLLQRYAGRRRSPGRRERYGGAAAALRRASLPPPLVVVVDVQGLNNGTLSCGVSTLMIQPTPAH